MKNVISSSTRHHKPIATHFHATLDYWLLVMVAAIQNNHFPTDHSPDTKVLSGGRLTFAVRTPLYEIEYYSFLLLEIEIVLSFLQKKSFNSKDFPAVFHGRRATCLKPSSRLTSPTVKWLLPAWVKLPIILRILME